MRSVGLFNFLKRRTVQPSVPITFFVRLDEEDWDDNQGAWRCSALKIPTAEVTELRSQGALLAEERYKVDGPAHQIQWIGGGNPKTVSVRVLVTQTLVTATSAEAERRDSASRVATIGAMATVFAAAISGASGYYGAQAKAAGPSAPGSGTAPTTADSSHPISNPTASVSATGETPQESIPIDADQVRAAFSGKSCVLSNVGLFPYCMKSSVTDCSKSVATAGGPFAANHHCVAVPHTVYCGAYRSNGSVRTICYASQNQCDANRLSYRVVPTIGAVSDSCREVSVDSH